MPALLRVRVPAEVKARLEALAEARHTDPSDLTRQALYAKYPELKAIAASSAMAEAGLVAETPVAYVTGTAIPTLIDAIRQQTAVMQEMLSRNAEPPTLRLEPRPEESEAGAETHAKPRKPGSRTAV
jgi:predicted transcriptional regulator